MKKKIREAAIKKATQSISKFRISAIALDKKGKIIATACNKPRFGKKGGGLHAEVEVLRRGGIRVKTIVICRIGHGEDVLPIEPCENCRNLFNKLGIKIISINI